MKQRILTGLLGGAGFIAVLFAGNFWFSALILLFSIIGYREYLRMYGDSLKSAASIVGMAAVVYLTVPWSRLGLAWELSFGSAIWLLLLLLLSITVATQNRTSIDTVAHIFIGAVYIGVGFHYMIYTRLEDGLFWTLFIFACIWLTDSGAYFIGRALGKHLLWPAISPKKTIEGALGGILLSTVGAISFALYCPELLSLAEAALSGVLIAVVGQLGDLIQSAYKRVKGLKDTGTLFPGHGGVLDRCDSWLIVFPFVQIFLFIH